MTPIALYPAGGIILLGLIDRSRPNGNSFRWPSPPSSPLAGMLVLQLRADEPQAATVGRIVVIALAGAFALLRNRI